MQETPAKTVHLIRSAADAAGISAPAQPRLSVYAGHCRQIVTPLAVQSIPLRSKQALGRAINRHQAPDDFPPPTPYYRRALTSRLPLVQVRYQVPDCEAERQRPARLMLEPAQPSSLMLGPRQIAALLCITRRAVYHAFEHDLVDVIASDWRGAAYRYALVGDGRSPNSRLARWARRHERWIRAADIDSGLAPPAEIKALGQNRSSSCVREDARGRLLVYAGFAWLQWAAARRPEEQRRRILEKQILTT